MKAFRLCLSKFRLDFIAMHTFIDKVHGSYKNGLDGKRDMRNFSGLFFFLRVVMPLVSDLSHFLRLYIIFIRWFAIGTIFFFTSLIFAVAKPYRKTCMNYLDITILSHLAITCYALSSCELLTRILLTIPITVFILTTLLKKCYGVSKGHCKVIRLCKYCFLRSRNSPSTDRPIPSSIVDNSTESQPFIQPTSAVISYGTCKDN